jgi:ATP-dependent DNA ligase
LLALLSAPTPKNAWAAYLSLMPEYEFCIPTTGKVVPAGAEWLHEVKYDGYRIRQLRW